MQGIYQCTRCGTGWLAKMVEPSGHGWAVRVFVCSHCLYASQPGVLLSMEDEGALLASVHTAIVPVASLTGPGVEGRPRRGARHSSIRSRLLTARWTSSLCCTECGAYSRTREI